MVLKCMYPFHSSPPRYNCADYISGPILDGKIDSSKKGAYFFPASGVSLSCLPYTSKFSLAFSVIFFLLDAQTFSILCLFTFYVVKFCDMMP